MTSNKDIKDSENCECNLFFQDTHPRQSIPEDIVEDIVYCCIESP